MQELQHLFYPKSVAIIGASKSQSINTYPLKFLMDRNFSGHVYPINPNYTEIKGIECYPTILDVPEKVDIAIVLVSAERSLQVIKECVTAGVRFAVMLSAGFSETGSKGKELEKEIQEAIEGSNTRVLGPNSIGFLNLEEEIPIGFAYPFSLKEYLSGSVAICSQSGAYGLGLWTRLQEERIGVKYLATTGNELDVSIADFINYFSVKSDIKVISVYIEGFAEKTDAINFFEALQTAKSKGKQVVIVKSGKSEVGEKATQSHTASLTGAYDIFSVKCIQYGAYLVDSFTDQVNITKLLNTGKTSTEANIGIVTTSGALGIITADVCHDYNLFVPQLKQELIKELSTILPTFSSTINPIDVTAQVMNEPWIIKNVLDALVLSDQFEYIILLSSTISGAVAENFAKAAIEVNNKSDIPVLVCLTGGEMISGEIRDKLQDKGVSFFRSPEEAVRTISHIKNVPDYQIYPDSITSEHSTISINKQNYKTEKDAKDWLSAQGFEVPSSMLITSSTEVNHINETFNLNWPVILKGQVNHISHKTEYGLVQTNIHNIKDLKESLHNLWNIIDESFNEEAVQGILIEEQASEAIEVLVGARWDPLLGPVLVFGSGGIFVEILKDITLAKVPLTECEALNIIKESKIYPILNGYRKGIKYDIESLVNFITKFSKIVHDMEGNINEIEINPLFVLPENEGVKIIDALIV